MRHSERSVAPVLAVVLMVAVVVLIGASATGFVLLIAESISEPAPAAAFETETTEDGTILLQHTAGDSFDADDLEINGGEVRGEMPEIIDAGKEIEIAPSRQRTDLVWQGDDSDDEAVLTSLETSPHPLTAAGTSKRWKTEEDDEIFSSNRIRDLAVGDDAVYLVGVRRDVRALYPENGSIKWQETVEPTDWRARTLSVDESHGVVYVGTASVFDDGSDVTALDASDKELIWQHSIHENDVVSVQESNGIIYSLDRDGEIAATDASGGDVRWNESFDVDSSSLSVVNEVIYTGTSALDADDGSPIWVNGDRYGDVRDVDVRDGVVYVGETDDGIVAALDASDGSMIWEKQLDESINENSRAVHVDRGVLYAGVDDSRVFAMDADDGSILWSHDRHNDSVSAIAVDEDIVYSTGEDTDDRTYSVELEFADG